MAGFGGSKFRTNGVAMTIADSRFEDLLSGPWSPLSVPDLTSSVHAEHEAGGSAFLTRPAAFVGDQNLEFMILISLAVRSDYVSFEPVREFCKEMIETILETRGGASILDRHKYWPIIELAVRIDHRRFEGQFVIKPISSDLQVFFASLLAVHREMRTDLQLASTLNKLDRIFSMTSRTTRDDRASDSAPIKTPSLSKSPSGSNMTAQIPVAAVWEDAGQMEEMLDLVQAIGRVFSPMNHSQRAALGSLYSRVFYRLTAQQEYGANSGLTAPSDLHSPALIRMSLKDKLDGYASQHLGSEASEVSHYLGVIEATQRAVEDSFFARRNVRTRNGGGSGQKSKPSHGRGQA